MRDDTLDGEEDSKNKSAARAALSKAKTDADDSLLAFDADSSTLGECLDRWLECSVQDMGLLFASQKGTPLDASNVVSRSYKPLLRRAELPNIRFHDLRHTCATLLLLKNVNPKFVQRLLGHKSIKITLDLYSHWIPEMDDFTADAMDEIF